MISLQRSMHSSQMYTPGPAMSFLTCFWLFPQKEHLSRSPPSPMRATRTPSLAASRAGRRDVRSSDRSTAVDYDGTAFIGSAGAVTEANGVRMGVSRPAGDDLRPNR